MKNSFCCCVIVLKFKVFIFVFKKVIKKINGLRHAVLFVCMKMLHVQISVKLIMFVYSNIYYFVMFWLLLLLHCAFFSSKRLVTLARGLAPAFLRFGGKRTDFLQFNNQKNLAKFRGPGPDYYLKNYEDGMSAKAVFCSLSCVYDIIRVTVYKNKQRPFLQWII